MALRGVGPVCSFLSRPRRSQCEDTAEHNTGQRTRYSSTTQDTEEQQHGTQERAQSEDTHLCSLLPSPIHLHVDRPLVLSTAQDQARQMWCLRIFEHFEIDDYDPILNQSNSNARKACTCKFPLVGSVCGFPWAVFWKTLKLKFFKETF